MKRIEISLTQEQVDSIKKAKGEMKTFGLLAQPLLASKTMKVLILRPKEFGVADRFFKRFVPKKYRVKS